MAKVLNPLMSGSASGTFNNMTFSSGKAGPISRLKPNPVRRVRQVQQTNRALLAYISRAYGLLTQTKVDLWKAYADAHPRTDVFGQSYTMSPSQAFMGLNHVAMRLGTGTAEQDEPPVTDPPANLITLTPSDGAADGTVKLDWTALGTPSADDFVEVWVSEYNQSLVRTAEIQRFSFNQAVAGNLTTASVEDLIVGGWYWFKVRYTDEFGQTTPWLYAQWEAPDIA